MFQTKRPKSDTVLAGLDRAYSSSEVAEAANVSLRQLQWWDERKVVSPRHEGHKRVYTLAELVEISVIAELRRKGFSLQKIRRVLKFLQKDLGKRLSDVVHHEASLHLVTDGKSLYLESENDRVIDILKGASQPMFLVCVSDQVRRLTAPPAPTQQQRKPARRETTAPRKVKAI